MTCGSRLRNGCGTGRVFSISITNTANTRARHLGFPTASPAVVHFWTPAPILEQRHLSLPYLNS